MLDEDTCPPLAVHDVRDYPVYYDALYYPQYYEAVFSTAHSFCSWLLESLLCHHRTCFTCTFTFSGCVSFDGVRIVVTSNGVSVSQSLPYFERAAYRHCTIIRMLHASLSLAEYFASSIAQHPPWLFATEDVVRSRLARVSASTLSQIVTRLGCVCVGRRRKTNFIRAICVHFVDLRTRLLSNTVSDVEVEFASVRLPVGCDRSLLHLLCAYFETVYGSEVAAALRLSPPPTYVYDSVGDSLLPWTTQPMDTLVRRLRKIRLAILSESMRQYPLLDRPVPHPHSRAQTANRLVAHIRTRVAYLQIVGSPVLWDIWLSYHPYTDATFSQPSELITHILVFEYGSTVVDALAYNPLSLSDRRKLARRDQKLTHLSVVATETVERQNQWPVVVPEHTVLACQAAYLKGSRWEAAPVCAVCSQYQESCQLIVVSEVDSTDLHLESLRLTDRFILQKCILQSLSSRFTFGSPLIDGLMLEPAGVVTVAHDSVSLNVCGSCHSALRKPLNVPRLALRNNLYRGELPIRFRDLTWIEEKVCAIYSVTAHVTRLFQSTDPAHARTFHGNTCAHEMNVVSTATVLPRTPADISGFLSVVFVGPG